MASDPEPSSEVSVFDEDVVAIFKFDDAQFLTCLNSFFEIPQLSPQVVDELISLFNSTDELAVLVAVTSQMQMS